MTQSEQSAMRGTEKAAILCLALGPERGASLMKGLREDEIARLTREMAGLGSVPAERVEAVLEEFQGTVEGGGPVVGSVDVVERMLAGFLPEDRIDDLLKDVRGPLGGAGLWERFRALGPKRIAAMLEREHDQMVAGILAQIPPEEAARVLEQMPSERMTAIATCMIGLDALSPQVLSQIEETLSEDVRAARRLPEAAGADDRMVALFSAMSEETFGRLATALEAHTPEAFGQIRSRMFTFPDMVDLDDDALAAVVREAEGKTVPLALRGADQAVRDAVMRVLPARSRDMLEDEIASLGAVRAREAREAQGELVALAKTMAEEGRINLPGEREDMIAA